MKILGRASTQILRRALVLCFLWIGWPFLTAQDTGAAAWKGLVRLDPDPRALQFADAVTWARENNGEVDWETLLNASLWASGAGTAPRTLTAGQNNPSDSSEGLRNVIANLRKAGGLTGDGRTKAEAVFALMHQNFLRAYLERQTRLDVLLRTGYYNCVSSAVLYAIMGRSVGLDIRGVATRDHAFCLLRLGDTSIDVETTSPLGFDPGSKTEFHDAFGRVTGFAYVPPRNYADRTNLDPMELVSLILSNRIAEADAAGRFAESVGCSVDRLALLSYEASDAGSEVYAKARGELTERLLNFGTALARDGKEASALEWAAYVQGRFGQDPRWLDFCYSALNNLVVRDLRRRAYQDGRANLSQWASLVSEDKRNLLETLLTDGELTAQVQAAQDSVAWDSADTAIAQAQRDGRIGAPRAVELRVFGALSEAQAAAKSGGYGEALQVLDRAISRIGPEGPLVSAQRVFRANRVAELHNGFAELFNQHRFDEAKTYILSALQEFPQEGRLQQDLDIVEKNIQKNGSP